MDAPWCSVSNEVKCGVTAGAPSAARSVSPRTGACQAPGSNAQVVVLAADMPVSAISDESQRGWWRTRHPDLAVSIEGITPRPECGLGRN